MSTNIYSQQHKEDEKRKDPQMLVLLDAKQTKPERKTRTNNKTLDFPTERKDTMITKEHRQQIEKDFEVEDGVITTPGKFEGSMVYVPAFWDLTLEGGEDEIEWDGDTLISIFHVTSEDRGIFPELQGAKTLEIWEDSFGFVWANLTED